MAKSRVFRTFFAAAVLLGGTFAFSEITRSQSEKMVWVQERAALQAPMRIPKVRPFSEPRILNAPSIQKVTKPEVATTQQLASKKSEVISLPMAALRNDKNNVPKKTAKSAVIAGERRERSSPKFGRIHPDESHRLLADKPLFTNKNLQLQIGSLPYVPAGETGVHFQYAELNGKAAGHRWFFAPHDLRGRTIRIFYSGIVPNEIILKLSKSSTSAAFIQRARLKDSPTPRIFSFQVPRNLPFASASQLGFEIEQTKAGRGYGDFQIEKVEALKTTGVLS